ncbi:DUF2231 domain-containing protein [Deinococcus sp. QL22]|uniref:DUF2231 domain-containing protein n=1 Tax=Deinococcus sp. QL22 TaxID=2939437 RepID=UPI002016D740|nr:DUF2231 domain-containing protein [Deinococcus sp. QL22]UQN09975.1 DUF2231 domain-containing protein [Deinococcus sp. QL22]
MTAQTFAQHDFLDQDSEINDQIEDALSQHDSLEAVADVLQRQLQAAERHLSPALIATLHGQPLGHPLHPILVHLPLGGWLVAGILDFYPGQKSAETEHAADLALLLGTVGAVGAIAAGWTDWANTRGEARRTGLIHGALNESAFFLNGASLLARRKGRRGLGKVLSGTALVLALGGGFLGGQLVYRHGLGVGKTLATPQG